MNDPEEGKKQSARLRWRAEEALRRKAAPERSDFEGSQRTIHELRVYQIELTMQNEELLRIQRELDSARARYFDLYDLAPVGYCIVSQDGLVLEANLTAVTLLGTARSALVKQPITRFILPEDQDIYYLYRKRFLELGTPNACELRMIRPDGSAFWVRLTATIGQNPPASPESDSPGERVVRLVMSDISDRKKVEEEKARLEDQIRQTHRKRPSSTQAARDKDGRDALRK
jgi:PAS domain S-box-containing protein